MNYPLMSIVDYLQEKLSGKRDLVEEPEVRLVLQDGWITIDPVIFQLRSTLQTNLPGSKADECEESALLLPDFHLSTGMQLRALLYTGITKVCPEDVVKI